MPENITKLKDTTLARCCERHEVMPKEVCCFAPDIYAELKQLHCLHKHAFTRRKRLLHLAIPKRRIVRFTPKCACRFGKNIEMVQLEKPVYTRTEQLAYPPIRKILLFKETFKHLFPEQRLEIINRLARYSLFSLYSRLQNIHPPIKKIPIKKWDAAEWKTHTKYLKKLSKPKKAPKVPKMPNPTMPLKKMKRFKNLAHPKIREELEKLAWALTPEMKYYNPTPRVLLLAKPLIHESEEKYNPFSVEPQALKYKASKRIKELATAAERRLGESDLKENPFAIPPNALKYKASNRITELAEPKEYENIHIRDNPQLISPAALKAKASPRIIELAKPKGSS